LKAKIAQKVSSLRVSMIAMATANASEVRAFAKLVGVSKIAQNVSCFVCLFLLDFAIKIFLLAFI
jgi:hypothetical protein